MLFFNIDDGYLEGLLRGYRAGILTDQDYVNLRQCESIEGACQHRVGPSLQLRPQMRASGRSVCAVRILFCAQT